MNLAHDDHLATIFYFDHIFGCDAAKILPGEYYVSKEDVVMVTVLGSCISACIRDRESGIGGMNHFMLPNSSTSTSLFYGNHAMEALINGLIGAGARRENLEAKVFGGGNVVRSLADTRIGERNADFVRDYLAAEKIDIVAEDLIDIYPRKIFFFPRSGKVLVHKLKMDLPDAVIEY